VGNKVKELQANKIVESIDIQQSLLGELSNYPFDNYTAVFYVLAEADNTGASATNETELLDSAVSLTGGIQGFVFGDSKLTNVYPGIVEVTIEARRSTISVGFSIFVILLMWLLSFMIFAMTVDILLRRREIVPPLLALPVAALFALPALRNSQPGIPPVGAYCDVVGFYWNMILIAISAIVNLIAYIVRYQDPKQKAETKKAEEIQTTKHEKPGQVNEIRTGPELHAKK
jgi:hypothetical protein